MATIAAGSSVLVTVAAGDVLRVSGNAEITRLTGMTESLNGNGAYGPYEAAAAITIKAISAVIYSSETPAGEQAFFLDENGNLAGVRNTDATSVRLGGSGVSKYYKFFIPGQQFIGSGDANDRSGNSANAARLASLTDAAAWANPGYITTGAGANFGAAVALAKVGFDLGSQSIIVSARIKKAAPVGNENIFGCGDSASAQGFYISMRAAAGGVSKVRPVINTSGGVVAGLADSTATFGEAAATDHVLTLAIDGITKNIYLYCDGSLSNTYAAAFSGGTTLSAAFGFGSQQGNAGAVSVACQFSGMHLLVMDGPLPTNHGLIAQRLAAQPHYYLTDLDFEF